MANAKGQVNHFGVHGTFKPPRVLCNTSMRFSLTSYHRRLQALLSTSAPSQIRTCPRITSSCSRSAPLSNKVRKGSVPSVHVHLLTGLSEPYLLYVLSEVQLKIWVGISTYYPRPSAKRDRPKILVLNM